MIREIFALRRLRWKLTLSYTLVAAVTLLALELILSGGLVAFLNSDLPPRIIAQNLRDEIAPRLEKPMRQNPPDAQAVRRRLDVFARTSGVRGIETPPPPPTSFGDYAAYGGALFVVDEEHDLLVSVPTVRGLPEGERFDASKIKGLQPLVNAGLSGEENSGALSVNFNGQLLTVTPIAFITSKVVELMI